MKSIQAKIYSPNTILLLEGSIIPIAYFCPLVAYAHAMGRALFMCRGYRAVGRPGAWDRGGPRWAWGELKPSESLAHGMNTPPYQ